MPRKYAVMQVHILYVHARRECYFHSWPHLTLNPPADSSAGTSEADLSRGAADMQLLCVRPTRNWEVTGSVPTTTARRNLTSSRWALFTTAADRWAVCDPAIINVSDCCPTAHGGPIISFQLEIFQLLKQCWHCYVRVGYHGNAPVTTITMFIGWLN